MRVLVRPFVLLTLMVAFSAAAQSQQMGIAVVPTGTVPPGTIPPGGLNNIQFTPGMPQPTSGGVDVGLSIQPAGDFKCTSVTITIVDQNLNTLATITIQNPGATVSQTFSNLGSDIPIQITVIAVFQDCSEYDYPYLEANVTTN